MIHVIGESPDIILFIQEGKIEKCENGIVEIWLNAFSFYSDIKKGSKFDCVYEMDNGKILYNLLCEVVSINIDNTFPEKLPANRAGKILFRFFGAVNEMLSFLSSKTLSLTREAGFYKKVFIKNLVFVENVNKYPRALSILQSHQNLIVDGIFFFLGTSKTDLYVGQKFDLLWDMTEPMDYEEVDAELVHVITKDRKKRAILSHGYPTLIGIKFTGLPLLQEPKDIADKGLNFGERFYPSS